MITIQRTLATLGAALALSAATASAQAAPKSAGHWEGKIHMGPNEVPMTVDLSKDASGKWIGAFTVPGSAQTDIPLINITADDANVRFSLSLADTPTFEGKLSADGINITGTASNSQGSVGFDLARTGDAHVNVPAPSTALPKEFDGRWEGVITAGANQFRLGLKLTTGTDGKAAAMLTSIDQGGQEFPASTVTVDGKKLTVELRAISSTFSGTLGENGEIAGEWTQAGAKLPVTFKRAADDAKKPL